MFPNIPDITIKRNDAGKVISGQLLDANGSAVNCTGFTSAKLFMRLENDSEGTAKINGASFSFSNVASGNWSYTMTSTDVDTSGKYVAELEVAFGAGVKQTFPTDPENPYITILIQDDLG